MNSQTPVRTPILTSPGGNNVGGAGGTGGTTTQGGGDGGGTATQGGGDDHGNDGT